MGERTGRLLLAWGLAAAVAGCGGKTSPAPGGSTAVIGSAGGTVSEASGATVIVPPGAFEAEATLHIAKDSTGAPPPPPGLDTLGDIYLITPHGGTFLKPVEVRIPVPAVTLQPNQALKLLKAEPGGEWVVLDDTVLVDGTLRAKVYSFSSISFGRQNLRGPQSLVLSASLDCGGHACASPFQTATATYTVTTSGGQLPTDCASGSLNVQARYGRSYGLTGAIATQAIPLGGGAATFSLVQEIPGMAYVDFVVGLSCGDHSVDFGMWQELRWKVAPGSYPGLEIMDGPLQLDVVEGMAARLEVLLAGGSSILRDDGLHHPPTQSSRAVVDWQRSDDLGNSWRTVAQSFEDEANPRPVASATVDWALWSVTHGFVAATADQGALIRAHACFTPPDVPAPPCVTGPATRLNVLQQSALPVIVDAPRSVLVTTGQAASFTASAGGAPAPSLQWQTRAANDTGAWADVSSGTGATTGSYTTAPLSLADNGRQYRVVATNAVASAASPGVTASVSDLDVPPTITTQPASLNVATGSDAAFAVAALGTETLSYQWSLDGTPITGATTPVLRLPAVTAGNAGSYVVVVTNIAGTVASDPAILTVSPGALAPVAPTIVTQPAAVTVHAGDTATFAVGMSGSGPLSFQWRKDGAAIAGATEAAITLASAVPADAGAYSVVVGNAAGTVTSADAALAVTVIPPPVVTAPTISTQPATLVVVPGGAATLAVAASGTGPLAYQWSLGGTPVAGATGPVLTIPSVGPADAGSYTVTVSNVAGSVTSAPAQLILVGAPVITTQPASASAVEGSMATFTVAATGDAPHYQWERNGVPMAGAVAASYTTPLLTAGDSGAIFDVLVYNAVGLVFSHPAVLTVTPAPSVSMPPSTGKLSAGPSHTCAIKTDGTVACWGHNSSREVTVVAPFGDQDLPVVVSGLSGMAQVAVGFQRTCAIGGLGNLVCWGRGSTGVQPLLDGAGVAITGARAVTLGDYHGCFIDAGTGVQCWGDNSVGQLGQGTISLTPMATPVVVSRGGSALTGVVGLSAGGFYTCALTSVGDVVCWGQGAIGDGSVMPGGGQRAVYAAVPAVTGASAMVSGGAHACAVLAAGGMKCWGANASAQLGNRNTTDQLAPVSVVDPSGLLVGVTLVAAQSDTTCVIPASGQVVCWGAVRPASLTGVLTYGPVVKSSLAQRVVGLASGGNHSCALVADGSLECWGANQYGQLGVGGFISLDTGGPSPPGTSVFGGAIFW